MRKVLIGTFFCLCNIIATSYCQNNDKIGVSLPSIVPPSPDAVSLGKFGQYSVSDGYGNPNIAIPLFEIKTSRLSVPISLSYHGAGIRVDERASWAGLGWALNCGGVITRTVKGVADESTYGFLNRNLQSIQEIIDEDSYQTFTSYTDNIFDTHPDLFFYNYSGNAGKFILKRNGQAFSIPESMNKIRQLEGFSGFEILDESGNVYIFKNKEYTSTIWPRKTQSDATYYCTAWYLSSIISSDRSDTISFTYTSDNNQVDRIKSQTEQISDKEGHIRDTGSYVNTNYVIRLRQIDFKSGRVVFSTKSRLDLESSALDKIEVYQKIDTSYTKLKTIIFKSDYFQSTTGAGKDKYRLKLDSILFNDKNNLIIQKYKFEYNTDVQLPPVHSNAQDYWGYYNGKTNNSLLIPSQTINYGYDGPYNVGGADREPSANHLLAGCLKKIIYPTGGYTLFGFEPHVYLASNTTTTVTNRNFSSAVLGNNTSTLVYDDATFTANSEIPIGAYIEMYISDHDNDFYDPSQTPKVGLLDVTTGSIVVELTHRGDPATSKQQTGTYTLVSGHQYKLYAQFYGAATNRAFIDCSFQETTTTNTPVIKQGAGIRIGNITSYDLDNRKIRETQYRYSTDGHDYGLLRTPEALIKTNYVEKMYYYLTEDGHMHSYGALNFSNVSLFELATLFGSYVNYDKVEEIEVNNGKTVRQYELITDDIERSNFDLSDPWLISSNDWKSGMLIREETYSEESGQYVLVRSLTNLYKTEDTTFETGLDISRQDISLNFVPSNNHQSVNYSMNERSYKTGSKRLTNQKVTYFSPAGNVQTEKRNYYTNPGYLYPNRVVELGSKSDSTISLYRFAFDKAALNDPVPSSAELSAIDSLIKRNIIGSPVQIEVYKNSDLVNKERIQYKNWSARVVAPDCILAKADNNSPIEKRLQFYNYDNYGNILERSKVNDMKEVYLWGYNNQYPVARIVGTNYATAISFVNQIILQNPLNDTQLRDELNKIRTNLASSSVLVTTYTYQPVLGVTSETDPSGKTVYYEYDDFGRLKLIKDQNGKILKQYDYQYQKPIIQ